MEKDSFAAARFIKNGVPPLVSFSGSEDGVSSPKKNLSGGMECVKRYADRMVSNEGNHR
jgi:hypothetical protein